MRALRATLLALLLVLHTDLPMFEPGFCTYCHDEPATVGPYCTWCAMHLEGDDE